MNKQHYLFILLCCSLTVTSCAKTFDTSSEEAFQESVQLIKKDLSLLEKKKLESAVAVLDVKITLEKLSGKHESQPSESVLHSYLHNKNYNQVISMAENFLKSYKKEEIQKNDAKLNEVTQKYHDLTILDGIKVKSAHIIEGREGPIIEVDIENDTSLTFIGENAWTIHIDSISHDKTLETKTYSAYFDEPIKPKELFSTVYVPLEELMGRSKKLTEKLKNATYPVNDLAVYDLKVQLQITQASSADGKKYDFVRSKMDDYRTLIAQLKTTRANIEKWPITITGDDIILDSE